MNVRIALLGLLLTGAPTHQPIRAPHYITMGACLVGVETARAALELPPSIPEASRALCADAFSDSWDLLENTTTPRVGGCILGVGEVFGSTGHGAELKPMSERARRADAACERLVLALVQDGRR